MEGQEFNTNSYAQSGEPLRMGFNWGAFFMPLQFGFANKAYLCFLTLVPILSIVWVFVAGFNGAKWAYNSGNFASPEEFNAVMKSWNRAGLLTLIVFGIAILIYIIAFASIMSMLQGAVSMY